MKTVLCAAVLALSIYGQSKSSVEQTLMQMERDWAQAEIRKDFAAVERFLADDWSGIDYDGSTHNKAAVLDHLKTGASSLESQTLSGMQVRLFGSTAIVTGTDIEKSRDRGKDTTGKYAWTDVFVLRNGRWQVVASQSTKMN